MYDDPMKRWLLIMLFNTWLHRLEQCDYDGLAVDINQAVETLTQAEDDDG